jgi:hypothetical protein
MINTTTTVIAEGGIKMKKETSIGLNLNNRWSVTCVGSDGEVKWSEEKDNLITTEGLNHILDTTFHAGTAATTWYIGLKDTIGAAAAADTLASHSTWTELTGYSGTRKEWTEGASSAGSMTNSSSVDFAINATATVAGAFLASATSGTTGTLYGIVDFTAARSVLSGDTLQITVTVTAS